VAGELSANPTQAVVAGPLEKRVEVFFAGLTDHRLTGGIGGGEGFGVVLSPEGDRDVDVFDFVLGDWVFVAELFVSAAEQFDFGTFVGRH